MASQMTVFMKNFPTSGSTGGRGWTEVGVHCTGKLTAQRDDGLAAGLFSVPHACRSALGPPFPTGRKGAAGVCSQEVGSKSV